VKFRRTCVDELNTYSIVGSAEHKVSSAGGNIDQFFYTHR
jgi:hypothetical protein